MVSEPRCSELELSGGDDDGWRLEGAVLQSARPLPADGGCLSSPLQARGHCRSTSESLYREEVVIVSSPPTFRIPRSLARSLSLSPPL